LKKKTKPTSVRLESDFEQDLKEKCKGLGCSKSDYLQEAGKFMVYGSSEFDFGDDDQNSQDQEENIPGPDRNPTPKEEPKPTVNWLTDVKVVEI